MLLFSLISLLRAEKKQAELDLLRAQGLLTGTSQPQSRHTQRI